MNILIVHKFKNVEAFEILETVINDFEGKGKIIHRGTNVFWIKCNYELAYKFFTNIYNAFKGSKVLDVCDSIDAFFVSAGTITFSMARLKKEKNKTLQRVDFEFLKSNHVSSSLL